MRSSGLKQSSFTKWCPLLDPKNLAPFFDVSSRDVGLRLGHSLIPFNPRFHPLYHAKPDLYGPFWILTSLIASLFIAGNISRYIRQGKDKFEYNFTVIPIAAGVLYGVGLGLPLLISSLLKWFGSNIRKGTPVVSAIGIYGYSFSSFLFVSMICAIPIDWLQWLFISYAALTSIGFLIRTYWTEFSDNLEPAKRFIAIALICSV